MPDVTVSIGTEDDVTPALNKIKGTINEVTQSTAALVEEGRLLTQGFERAGISIANAMRLGSQEQKAAMQAYLGGGGGKGSPLLGSTDVSSFEETKESMGGMAGEMAKMGETFLKWGVAWQVLEAGLKGVEAGINQVVGAFQVYNQWANKLGADNEALGSTFNGIVEAAMMTGTSIQETSTRVAAFYASGFDTTEAVRATEAVQIGIKQTGVDLTQAYTEANLYKASIQSLKDVAARTGDEELRQKAVEQEREANTLKYYNFEMQQRQQAEGYALSDSNRAIAEYTEAHQREVSEDLADRQRATRQDLEEKIHAIDRERAASKRAIAEEMQDRHRAAAEAEADAERLHNRQMSDYGGLKGVMEAATAGLETGTTGKVIGKSGKDVTSIVAPAIAEMRKELDRGMVEYQKTTGIRPSDQKTLLAEGILSPEMLLREAQAGREEERTKAERGRAGEERGAGRAQAKEDTAQDEMNYQARKQMEKALGDEERTVHRNLAADRLKIEHEIADSERELTRRNAKERDELAKHFLTEEIERIGLISQARIKAQGKELDEYKAAMKALLTPQEPGQPLVAPAGAPSGEAPASEGTLQKIQETLAQLLSGG